MSLRLLLSLTPSCIGIVICDAFKASFLHILQHMVLLKIKRIWLALLLIAISTTSRSQSSCDCSTIDLIWFKAVAKAISIPEEQLLLCQGTQLVPRNNAEFWNFLDSRPVRTACIYLDPCQYTLLPHSYSLLMQSLAFESNDSFSVCMDTDYTDWLNFISLNYPMGSFSIDTIAKVFTQWATINAPSKLECLDYLKKNFTQPLNNAIVAFDAAQNSYAWDKTADNLSYALSIGKPFSVAIDTSFFVDKSTFDQMKKIFGQIDSTDSNYAHVEIHATANKLCILYTNPYSIESAINPLLPGYHPWFSNQLFAYAYSSTLQGSWSRQSWSTFFGSNGLLSYSCSGIVVASNIDVTIICTMTQNVRTSTNNEAGEGNREAATPLVYRTDRHVSNPLIIGVTTISADKYAASGAF